MLSLGLSGLLSTESLDGAETGLQGKDSKVDGKTLGPSTLTGCCFSCSPLSYPQAWDCPRDKIIFVAQETPYYTVINFNVGALSHTLPMKN